MTSGDSGTCTIFSLMETNDGTLDAETFTQHRNRLVLHEATSGNEIGRATVLDTHRRTSETKLETIGSSVIDTARQPFRWPGLRRIKRFQDNIPRRWRSVSCDALEATPPEFQFCV
jgi:hypothetical protein